MRGFTLIEVLVYLALFSLLMTGVIASMLHLRESARRIEASARLTDEGHFILERLRYAIETEGIKDIEITEHSKDISMHDWSVVTEAGSMEIRFILSTHAAGVPVSFLFYGTFVPPHEP